MRNVGPKRLPVPHARAGSWPCDGCPILETGRGPVSNRGPEDASIVVVGQCPGVEEVARGMAFVGPSGKLLNAALEEAGFDPSNILFTNAVCCLDDRSTDMKVIQHCRLRLEQTISAHPRRLIITLGNEAMYAVLGGRKSGVTKRHGEIIRSEEFGCNVFVSLHPAYILRNLPARDHWVQQLRRAHALHEGDLGRLDDFSLRYNSPNGLSVRDLLTDDHWALQTNRIAIDVETTGLVYWRDTLLGVGLSTYDHAIYIMFQHGAEALGDRASVGTLVSIAPEDREWAIQWLRRAVGQDRPEGKEVVLHNSKFDAHFLLKELGIDIRPVAFDTMLAHHLCDENSPHGLKQLVQTWLMVEGWEDGVHEAMVASHLGTLPLEDVARYCATDCIATYRLAEALEERLEAEGCHGLYHGLVQPLSDMLVDVEHRGLLVDRQLLEDVDRRCNLLLGELETTIRDLAGWGDGTHCPWRTDMQDGLNPRSDQDVQQVLFGGQPWRLKPVAYTEKAKEPSCAAEPLQALLLHYKRLNKLHSTFVQALAREIAADGAVHATFLFNAVTEESPRTGRLSSSHPNLQNQPKALRPLFVARDGYVLWEADFSNLEVRVWAALSRDPALIQLFERSAADPNFDFHTEMASVYWGVHPEEVTPKQRQDGKIISFGGVMYGGGKHVIARMLDIPMDQAEAILRRMQRRFPVGTRWFAAGDCPTLRRGTTRYGGRLKGRPRTL